MSNPTLSPTMRAALIELAETEYDGTVGAVRFTVSVSTCHALRDRGMLAYKFYTNLKGDQRYVMKLTNAGRAHVAAAKVAS
jgi:hypothetical protein